MNVSQVKKDMVIKNYKEFCKLLDEPILAGNSKVAQLRKWQQYFQFTHRKQQFRIIKILKPPTEVTNGSGKRKIARRSGEVIDAFEPVMIKILQQEGKNGELNISRYTLYEKLGLISQNFISFNYVYAVFGERGIEIKNRSGFDKNFVRIKGREISNAQEMYFYEVVNDVIRHIYNNCIKILTNRGVVSSERWRELIFCNEIFVATEEEMAYIIKVENDIADKMKIKSPNAIFLSRTRDKFYKKRNEITAAELGWSSVYNILKVKILDEDLIANKNCRKKNINHFTGKKTNSPEYFNSYRQKLNEIVYNRVKERIEKEYKDFKENGVIKGTIGAAIRKKAFAYEDFIDTQQFLIDNLLKI